MSIFLRKVYRLSALIFPLTYFFSSRTFILGITGVVLLGLLILEIVRFKIPSFNRKIFSSFSRLLKDREKEKISGTTIFFIGVFITVLIFPKEIAILSLLYLVVGDALSGIVGFNWGRIRIGKKSLEGFLACWLSCLAIGLILRDFFLFSSPALILSSLAVALVELFPFVDDNLTIPLAGGAILYVLR